MLEKYFSELTKKSISFIDIGADVPYFLKWTIGLYFFSEMLKPNLNVGWMELPPPFELLLHVVNLCIPNNFLASVCFNKRSPNQAI